MSDPIEDERKDVDETTSPTNGWLIAAFVIAFIPVLKLIDLLHWVIDR